jgi:hypothetical protein
MDHLIDWLNRVLFSGNVRLPASFVALALYVSLLRLVRSILLRRAPGVKDKRLVALRTGIAEGVGIVAFFASIAPGGLPVVIPMTALIVWTNHRRTGVCEECRRFAEGGLGEWSLCSSCERAVKKHLALAARPRGQGFPTGDRRVSPEEFLLAALQYCEEHKLKADVRALRSYIADQNYVGMSGGTYRETMRTLQARGRVRWVDDHWERVNPEQRTNCA